MQASQISTDYTIARPASVARAPSLPPQAAAASSVGQGALPVKPHIFKANSLKQRVAKIENPHPFKYYMLAAIVGIAGFAFSYYESLRGTHQLASWGDIAVLVACLVGAMLFKKKAEKEERLKEEQKALENTPDPWAGKKPLPQKLSEVKAVIYTRIIGGLYMGNDVGFASTTHLPCELPNTKEFKTNNEGKFQRIITLCPLQELTQRCHYKQVDLAVLKERLSDSFRTHWIDWLYLGEDVRDCSEDWDNLVYNATFTDPPEQGSKSDAVSKLKINEWFEATFAILDQACLEDVRTLVHCARGDSRSATLVAAYLIKRRCLSYEQALSFLRQQRLCIEPQFGEQLVSYAHELNQLG